MYNSKGMRKKTASSWQQSCEAYVQQQSAPQAQACQSAQQQQQLQYFQQQNSAMQQHVDHLSSAQKTDCFDEAKQDTFHNPQGSDFDLGQDGSFVGYSVLLGNFVNSYLPKGIIDKLSLPTLTRKGFAVQYTESEQSFIKYLNEKKYEVVWVISGQNFNGDRTEFASAIIKAYKAGSGIYLWGDNDPYNQHVNAVIPHLPAHLGLQGCTMTGCDSAQKDLTFGEATTPGKFGEHLVTTGVEILYEGHTICFLSPHCGELQVLATSSHNKPDILCADSIPGQHGRLMVDCGFTKLHSDFWNTAGTPRYISNASVWLCDIENNPLKENE
eukprot:TRINITY_DN39490_c0_g1_i1.p1 TRINITY_DN39490_c0_g1~~TRINITY_DN39490_c0_g1_i1.p1  ORF type:complete len:353 (-),score=36.40 TRINITY_DN39490_c0_g1_i1:36-1016(-)